MTLAAGGKVDAGDFGGLPNAWTAYTPTLTNVTGGSGTFAYMLAGKTLFIRGNFGAGTVTALGNVSVSLPTGLTLVSGVQSLNSHVARAIRSCVANGSTNLLEISNSDGTGIAAATSLVNLRFTGVVEVA